jgi:UDP-2,3-diacylglucosamine pyrophosphatase LpxH
MFGGAIMRTAFISDLHFGDGSKADDFHRDEELIDFLKFTDGFVSKIVILGDEYELWQADMQDILWAHSDVMKALAHREHKIERVYGNHDSLPFKRIYPDAYTTKYIWAEHGHRYDEFNKDSKENPLFSLKWPIGKYITLAVAELERWVHKDADVWLMKQRKRFGDFLVDAALLQNKKWDVTDVDQVQAKMRILRENHTRYPVTIMGHTHQAEVLSFEEEFIYANCGTWVDDEYPTWVLVDDGESREGDKSENIVVQLRDGLDCSEVLEEATVTNWEAMKERLP